MPIRWLTIFLDFPAGSFDAGVAFWRQVTGYGLSPARGASGEFATLPPPSGDAYLRVQRLTDGAGGCHLDLHVAAEALAAATDRARSLGATLRHRQPGLVVAESPGGFPFCLTEWDGERAVPLPLAGPHSGDGGGFTRVDTLCIDVPAPGFERECAFWEGLTGWAARSLPFPEYVILGQQTDTVVLAVQVILQRLGESDPATRARAHVDFGCTDPDAVARHVALGARVVRTLDYWTVLSDPTGREYCLVNHAA